VGGHEADTENGGHETAWDNNIEGAELVGKDVGDDT
jgi:hypothetical protein